MANGFGAPLSPYPDTGGQDLPQPGTPEWAALMAMLSGQAPMAGQIPGQNMMATTTPTAGGGNAPVPGPLADSTVRPPLIRPPDPGAPRKASKPLVRPPDAPTPVADDDMLYPAKAARPTQPARPVTPTPATAYPPGTEGAPAQTITPVDDPAMLYPHRMISGIPGAPSNGAVPNLGYYRPTSGIAQGPGTWTKYDPNDPRIYRGPLASQPPAPAPGPVAPGAGTPWWQKLFGGGQPAA